MSTAIEELLGNLVAGEVIDRTERHPDEVGFLGVLTQRDGEFETLDLLGDIDQSLGVSLDEVETLQLVAGQGIIRGVILGQIDQLLIHDIAHQTDAVR